MAITKEQTDEIAEGLGLEAPAPATNFELPETPTFRFDRSKIEEQLQAPDERPSFMDAIGYSLQNDSSAAALHQWMSRGNYDIDLSFDEDALEETLKDPEVKKRMEALPEGVGEKVGGAVSRKHFYALLTDAEEEMRREMLIAAAPGGLAARLLAGLGDPLDWGVAAIPGLGIAKTASRLRNAVRAGLAASVSNAAVEASVAAVSPFRDEKDVMIASLAGFTLGAPLGALGRGADAEVARLASDAQRNIAKGDDAFAPGGAGLFTAGDESLAPLSRERTDNLLDGEYDPQFDHKAANKAQMNYTGTLLHSDSDITRRATSRIMETGTTLKDPNAPKKYTAELRANHIRRVMDTALMRNMHPHFKAWGKRKGYGGFRMSITAGPGREFGEEVGLAMQGWTTGISKEAADAANAARPLMKEWLRMAKEAGVEGFDEVADNPNYFPRMYNHSKWLAAREKYGEQGLIRFFRGAIMADAEDIPKEIAERIARGMVRTVTKNAAGMDLNIANGFSLDDIGRLREILEPEDADEVIAMIQRMKASDASDAGRVSRAKRRVRLDETYSVPIADKGTLRLADLIETDARRVLMRYSRVMAGHIGLAKEANIRSKADFEALKRSILDEGIQKNRLSAAQREVGSLDEVYKLITGTAVEADPYSNMSTASRMLSTLNYILVGGSFGVAQLPEIGNVIGHAGVRQFLRYMPEYRKLLKRAQDGKLEDELARAMEDAFAPGTDWWRNPVMGGFDDMGYGFESDTLMNRLASKVDPTLQSGARLTTALSLMAPINAVLQRMAGIHWAAQLADAAHGRITLSTKQVQRLRDAGVDEAMQAKIMANLKKHAKYDGKKLRNPHLEKWDDADAVDTFRMSGTRVARRLVQENDIGNSNRLLHQPFGRLLFQFMSFMFNSVNKQLLHGLKYHDIQTWVSWTTAMFVGTMAYVGQTYANYANDREQREKRLTPEKIAAAAVMRAGYAAVLPMIVDNGRAVMGYDPIFSYARNSGLGTTLVDSNATYRLARDVGHMLVLPGHLMHGDYQFSQENTAVINRLTPWHTLLGVRNGLAAVNAGLPESSSTE